jgi:hypothetical protein
MNPLSSGSFDALGRTHVLAKAVVPELTVSCLSPSGDSGILLPIPLNGVAQRHQPKPVGRNLQARRAPPAILQGRSQPLNNS